MKMKFWFMVGLMLFTMLALSGVVLAGGGDRPPGESSSVQITVEGQDPRTGVAEGDVIHEGTGLAGECGIPDVRIEMSGDVSKVRVGIEEGTCNLVVKELVPRQAEEERSDADADAEGYKWRVDALAKVVGFQSIDDLTKTRSKVDFKMANFTGGGAVFDGSNRAGSCWGNHFPSPPFYYYVDECVYDGSSLSGPTLIYSPVRGEYDHRVPLSPFGHTTTATAAARGYQVMPYVFLAVCTGSSLPPWPADLECELAWEYLGYE